MNNKLNRLLPFLTMAMMDERMWDIPSPTIKEKKEYCLNCGKEKNHNNCFCSSECSRIYKEKER
jgi:hypothetical protein